MININEKQKELIKDINNSSDIYKLLEDEIKKLILDKYKAPFIHKLLEKELNRELSLNSLRDFINQNKSKWINENKINKQNQNKEVTMNNKSKKSVVVGLINFKGGVGKSTIANLLDYEGSAIINIDMQNAEEINAGERTIDYFTSKDELEINTPSELIKLLEEQDIDLIFIDTPGAITEEFLDVLPLMDYVIIVANPNTRDVSQTVNTLIELKELQAKIIILYNKWTTEKELEDAKAILDNVAKNEFKNRFIGSVDLKYSRAIPTIDKTGKNIMELSAVYKVAYIQAKKNIMRLKDEIANLIGSR